MWFRVWHVLWQLTGKRFTKKSAFNITTLDEREASLQENVEVIKIQETVEHLEWAFRHLCSCQPCCPGAVWWDCSWLPPSYLHDHWYLSCVCVGGGAELLGLVMHVCVHTYMWRPYNHMITFGILHFVFSYWPRVYQVSKASRQVSPRELPIWLPWAGMVRN